MKDLTMIENELVPVYETDTGEKVVYGTELHKVLEVKSRFNDWIKNRINDCEAQENGDFTTLTKNLVSGGQYNEYIIKLDTAKEMAMLERNEKGKQVRRYFIQIEKKYQQQKPASTIDLIELELKAIKEVDGKIEAVNNDLQKFKKSMPLLGVEESRITCAVQKKGMKCLGGKDSAAYQDLSVRGRVYADIYRQLKREFGVKSYKAIQREKCDYAVGIVEGYKLPHVLAEKIKSLNLQMSMGGEAK